MRRRLEAMLVVGLLVLSACSGGSTGSGGGSGGNGADPVGQAPPLALAPVVTGLNQPLWAGGAPGQPDRLYVAERGGKVYIVKDGRRLPEPFADFSPLVTTRGSEQGLLGLAFHPDYARNGLLFVHYTGRAKGEVHIARVKRDTANPDRIDMASRTDILVVDKPYPNHNGGWIEFGPDGFLYIALGDGGGAGDPQNRAQNLETLLGKILRIEVGPFDGYRIPPSNPLVGKDGRDELWAWGLRNPWRDSFDRTTGDLWIGDVGQNEVEEIDRIPAGQGGLNFGWRIMEGNKRYSPGPTEGLTPPVATYTHSEGGCAVIGGVVYRGSAIPGLAGSYLFGDHCSGQIRRLPPGGGRPELLLNTEMMINGFAIDERGEVLVIDNKGSVNRLQAR